MKENISLQKRLNLVKGVPQTVEFPNYTVNIDHANFHITVEKSEVGENHYLEVIEKGPNNGKYGRPHNFDKNYVILSVWDSSTEFAATGIELTSLNGDMTILFEYEDLSRGFIDIRTGR